MSKTDAKEKRRRADAERAKAKRLRDLISKKMEDLDSHRLRVLNTHIEAFLWSEIADQMACMSGVLIAQYLKEEMPHTDMETMSITLRPVKR